MGLGIRQSAQGRHVYAPETRGLFVRYSILRTWLFVDNPTGYHGVEFSIHHIWGVQAGYYFGLSDSSKRKLLIGVGITF